MIILSCLNVETQETTSIGVFAMNSYFPLELISNTIAGTRDKGGFSKINSHRRLNRNTCITNLVGSTLVYIPERGGLTIVQIKEVKSCEETTEPSKPECNELFRSEAFLPRSSH